MDAVQRFEDAESVECKLLVPVDAANIEEEEILLGEDSDWEIRVRDHVHLGRSGDDSQVTEAEQVPVIDALAFKRAIIGVRVQEIVWGKIRDSEVCRISLKLSIRSFMKAVLEQATIFCRVLGASDSMDPQRRPKIARYGPDNLSDITDDQAGTEIVSTVTIGPEIAVPPGFTLKVFSYTRQKTYRPKSGFAIMGGPLIENDTAVKWEFDNIGSDRQNLMLEQELELLVDHSNSSFVVEFSIKAEVDFSTHLQTLGTSRKASQRRLFVYRPPTATFAP